MGFKNERLSLNNCRMYFCVHKSDPAPAVAGEFKGRNSVLREAVFEFWNRFFSFVGTF